MKAQAKAAGSVSSSASSAGEGAAGRVASQSRARARVRGLEDEEDALAMRAFQSGDPDAFSRLARRHEKGLYNFCLRMLGSTAAAEDGTQEILLRIVRSADRWTPKAKVRTWIYAIAHNYCVDERRKARHRKTESLDRPLKGDNGEAAGTALDHVADVHGFQPDRGADSALLRARLLRAMEALPGLQLEVFIMREQLGLSFKDIAEILEIPTNTAKSRMRYALESLRATLAEDGFGPETGIAGRPPEG